jgi:RNA polymerase sigma-70 factor (ECF subfamily)
LIDPRCFSLHLRVAAQLEVLMSRYVAGDERAFVRIHARTRPRLFAFLAQLACDRVQAEDLCQTTYLKLHDSRDRYVPGAPLLPWLLAIARNAFLDDLRARRRARVRVTLSGALPERVDLASLEPPSSELKHAINRAVAKLSPLQREAFVMTMQHGFSPKAAAAQIGASETAVKLRVHRAYLALRKALAAFHREAA